MEKLRDNIDSLISFAQPFQELLDSHMVNFITSNLYEKIPSALKLEMEALGVEEVMSIFWLHGSGAVFSDPSSEIKTLLDSITSISLAHSGVLVKLDEFRMNLYKKGCRKFESLYFTEFMTPKKSHEVEVMSVLIAELSFFTQCSHVIDIGDGKGYLSSILALEYKLKVLGIDCSDVKTEGAAKRSRILQKVWNGYRKKLGNYEPKSAENITYKQVTEFVGSSTNMYEMARNAFPNEQLSTFGICGLHTCGDLTPVSLNQFVINEDCSFVVNVPCCHHLLTEARHSGSLGFPMSRHLSNRNFKLGRNSLMMSLKAKQRIGSNKTTPNESLLYRAIVQQFFIDKFGAENVQNIQVGRIASKCDSFVQYVKTALAKLDYTMEFSEEEVFNYFKKYESMRGKMWIYSSLLSCFASVVESIILLDRLIYLKEQGFHDVHLLEMFDPVISPRCYGIVALRNSASSYNSSHSP